MADDYVHGVACGNVRHYYGYDFIDRQVVGESAAVILTAGSALGMAGSLFDSRRSLAIHLYILAVEGVASDRAYGTALVLIGAVGLVNAVVSLLSGDQ